MLDFTKRSTEITVWFHNLIHESVIPSSQYTECSFKKVSAQSNDFGNKCKKPLGSVRLVYAVIAGISQMHQRMPTMTQSD